MQNGNRVNVNMWMSEPVTNQEELFANDDFKSKMEILCMQVQAELCHQMEKIDGETKFFVDKWDRKAGGGGISCVMSDGKVFEKAGVNISCISGTLARQAVIQMKARLNDLDEDLQYPFIACGISSVIHPRNPHVPACHFNFRYFELTRPDKSQSWWFGGGSDLTPNFLVEEDVKHFHRTFYDVCQRHNPTYYATFKEWCDRYFLINHRNERRGVGGIFFDDLDSPDQLSCFKFVEDCAYNISTAYLPLVIKNKDLAYTDEDRDWQLVRRGRYVEFNLVYDRGTKFGLATPEARIESILMSLPLMAKWVYRHDVGDDIRRTKLLEVLTEPRDWI